MSFESFMSTHDLCNSRATVLAIKVRNNLRYLGGWAGQNQEPRTKYHEANLPNDPFFLSFQGSDSFLTLGQHWQHGSSVGLSGLQNQMNPRIFLGRGGWSSASEPKMITLNNIEVP